MGLFKSFFFVSYKEGGHEQKMDKAIENYLNGKEKLFQFEIWMYNSLYFRFLKPDMY